MKTILVVAGQTTPKGIPIELQAPLPTESLGLAYLAAALAAAGFEAVVLDGYDRGWTADETIARLLRIADEDDLIGFSVTHAALGATQRAVSCLRDHGFGGTILLGGWEATLAPRELLAQLEGADWVLCGEAEKTLPAAVDRLNRGRLLHGLPGLVGRNPGLGSPRRRVDFRRPGFPRHHANNGASPLPIQASRGCAYGRCRFCSSPVALAGGWRARQVCHLIDELAQDLALHGAVQRVFVDDEFFGPSPQGRERALAFAEGLIGSELKLQLTIDCRISDYEPTLFERLRAAGVERLFLGIESGSDAVLQRFAKGYSAETARQSLRQLRAQGFEIIPGYILFEPFMALAELRTAFEFLVTEVTPLTPTKFLNKAVPYVGTPLHRQVEASGLFRGRYPDLGYRFSLPETDRFYQALQRQTRSIVHSYKRALQGRPEAAGAATIAQQVQQMICTFDQLLSRAGA